MTKETKEIAVAFELRHLQGATRKRMKPEIEKEYNQFLKQYLKQNKDDTEKS